MKGSFFFYCLINMTKWQEWMIGANFFICSMPYAQSHYPFENKKEFEKSFPADFIAEGIDQTRGW